MSSFLSFFSADAAGVVVWLLVGATMVALALALVVQANRRFRVSERATRVTDTSAILLPDARSEKVVAARAPIG